MNEPKGCPTPGACSALAQIAALTKDRENFENAFLGACQDNANAQAEAGLLRQEVKALEKEICNMRANHPENACYDVPTWDKLRAQIAASQAREAKLREFAESIKHRRFLRGFYMPEDADDLVEAIALFTDDTALQQRLAQERERCAKMCEQDLCNRPSDPPANYFDGGLRHCADAIRSMK